MEYLTEMMELEMWRGVGRDQIRLEQNQVINMVSDRHLTTYPCSIYIFGLIASCMSIFLNVLCFC